jgi:hypothetical protein
MTYVIGVVRAGERDLWWKKPELYDREGRERLTAIGLSNPETRKLVFELIAHRIIVDAWLNRSARTHWFGALANTGLPRPRDSEPRGKRGWAWHAGFTRYERDEAGLWVFDALMLGHNVGHSTHRQGPLSGGGCDCVSDEEVAPLYFALKEGGFIDA